MPTATGECYYCVQYENMIFNKRLTRKNLLAHNDEKKLFMIKSGLLDYWKREGKAKFLKHVFVHWRNSNPEKQTLLLLFGVEG